MAPLQDVAYYRLWQSGDQVHRNLTTCTIKGEMLNAIKVQQNLRKNILLQSVPPSYDKSVYNFRVKDTGREEI